jgi:hypothetical protein
MMQVVIYYIFKVQAEEEDSGQYLKKEVLYHQMKEEGVQEAEAQVEEEAVE